jgi:hypothetical protein
LIKDTPKRISKDISGKYPRSVLQGGEVLISVRGTLGGVAVAPTEVKGWNISREIALAATLPLLDSQYVAAIIAAPQSQAWFKEVITGIAYTGINIADLKRLPIPIPSIEEQREIVRSLNGALARIDAAVSAHAASVTNLNRLDQALLARAFRGELVEQDSAEESVGILLARLAAEAAAKPEEPRKRMPRKIKSSTTREIQSILDVLRASKGGFSPEELFRQSGRDETDLEQVEKFYTELRQFVNDGKVKEKRPNSATVILTATP